MIHFRKILVILLFLICFQTAKADWIKQNANTLAWLHDVYFMNEDHGFIAGSNGTFLETKDGGKSWSKRKNFTEDTILQINFSDESNGWLLCERNIYNRGANASSYLMKTTDGGESWEKIEFEDGGRERITKIFFNQKGEGLAIGESGVFFELQTDGQIWKKSPSPIRYLLLDGFFSDEMRGTIAGAGGSIYFTEDAGSTWNRANVFGNSKVKFNSIFFIDQKTGWAVGTQGKIFQTTSGGKTWREQNSNFIKDLADVFFTTKTEGWAVGDEGVILHTRTAGKVWNLENTNSKHKLEKVFFIGKKGWTVGFGGTILFYDEKSSKNQSLTKPTLQRRNY